MCGFISITGGYDSDLATKAHRSMTHRGTGNPEHTLVIRTDRSFCGHNTLPFSSHKGTSQPTTTKAGVSAFVGEIFNWKEVAEKMGVSVESDTELANIIFTSDTLQDHVYDLDGFWTHATIRDDRSIVAYTDYLGQKPLFYRTDMNAVASEPAALAVLGKVTRDDVYLSNTMKWGYSPDTRTPWNEVKQVPPGCRYVDGVVSEYYDWGRVKTQDSISQVYKTLVKAVKDRTFSIQKIGVLLSGGIDSSLVYLLAKRVDPEVRSFHVENGESEFVKLLDPESTPLTYSEVTLEEAVSAIQTPSDLGSTIPQTVLADAVSRQGIRAVLTGDGADELFGGYRRAKEYDSQASDVFVELPYYHFQRLDRVMMTYTIEQRSPFLNPSIVKYALSLPRHLRTEKQVVKSLAREAGVPREIIDRPKLPLKSSQVKETPFKHRQDLLEVWETLFGGVGAG